MNAVWAIAAILVPWSAGAACVRLAIGRTGERPLCVSAGWFAGQVWLFVVLYVLNRSTGGISIGLALAILIIMTIVCFLSVRLAPKVRHQSQRTFSSDRQGATPGQESEAPTASGPALTRFPPAWLLNSALLLLAVKLLLVVLAHAYVPSRSNDAISIWLYKAKVIASLGAMPLDPGDPFYMGGSNPNYPPMIPMTAAWLPMAAGQWSEQLVTLPWLFHYANLLVMIVGGLGRWMATRAAILVACLIGSMPLLVIHAYRPGYADLPMACLLAAGTLFALTWIDTGRFGALLLAGLFAGACACAKREGAAWACLLSLCALTFGRRHLAGFPGPARWGIPAAAAIGGLGIASVVDFGDVWPAVRAMRYHGEAWPAMWRHVGQWASFLLMVPLALALIAGLMPRFFADDKSERARSGFAVCLTASLAGVTAAIFVLTPNVIFALNDQTPSRIVLQVAPACVMVLAAALSGRPTWRSTS